MMYPRKRKKSKRLLKLFLWILFFVIAYTMFNKAFTYPHETIHTRIVIASPTPTREPIHSSSQLGNVIQDTIKNSPGEYGIVVKNLKTGESYEWDGTKQFASGSLYKLWVMAVVYQLIQQEKFHETDTLSKNIPDLYHEFGVTPTDQDPSTGTLTQSVTNTLFQMITISDNNSALLLTDKIGVSSVATFLQAYGLSQSHVGIGNTPPQTSAEDVALFLEDLYKGILLDETYTKKALELLTQQRLNEKLPKYLPASVVVGHKTGELDTFSHDAGIVYSPSGDYIIAVLSQSTDTDQAKELIAMISKAVYTYFNPNNPTPTSSSSGQTGVESGLTPSD